MTCSIDSISTICLRAYSTNDIAALSRRIRSDRLPLLVQSWMRQNLSDRDLENGVFQRLSAVVLSAGSIRCSAPCPSADQIVCEVDPDF